MNQSVIWHPFTQHALTKNMTKIVKAEGAHIYTGDGRKIIDAISSWWVITHGHCHPRLIEAAREQAGKCDQVIFAGYTHDPAEKLADALVQMTPPGLDKVFFSDSGSTAVEVALKMALGFWHHMGEAQRTRIVTLEHGYHGDTIGTMAVGQRGVFNQAYAPLLFDVDTLPFPNLGAEQVTIKHFENLLNQYPNAIAALIIEPLVLGAGGMKMYSPQVLCDLDRLCKAHDVVLIVDEVMTGWGRTGTVFACDQADISPDILCTSKGLTGGMMGLAATLCHPRFFDAHYSQDRAKMFFHSSSFTANPIACAVGYENIKMWQDEPVQDRVNELVHRQTDHVKELKSHPHLTNVRQCGTVVAMDVKGNDGGYLSNIAPLLYDYFKAQDVLLRPLGNTVYILPPYCISQNDLDKLYDVISNAPDICGL